MMKVYILSSGLLSRAWFGLRLLTALVLALLPVTARAGSLSKHALSLPITTDTVWSTDQAITTDVVVQSGATLTIQGVTVTAAASDPAPYSKGLSDKIEIIVESGGALIVEPGAVLTALQWSDWYGVVFLPGSDGSITGAKIELGTVGVTIYGASPTISGNTIAPMSGRDSAVPGVGGTAARGEMAAGIVISGTCASQVAYNTIVNIFGGDGADGIAGSAGGANGGAGGVGQHGGAGGGAVGIQVIAGAAPIVRDNVISVITGGNGGNGGAGGIGGDGFDGSGLFPDGNPGGAGGISGHGGYGTAAYGISILGASPVVWNNRISFVSGGNGGDSGPGGAGGAGGAGAVPTWGNDGGQGGAGGKGGDGAQAGWAGHGYGIGVAGLSTALVWANSIIGPVLGGEAGAGGSGGQGGDGGIGGDGVDVMVGTGGTGGSGGAGGDGGQGGDAAVGGLAFGISAVSSSPILARNRVSGVQTDAPSTLGGHGGAGGNGGGGGDGGAGAIQGPGGTGGAGGDGGRGGDGVGPYSIAATGIFAQQSFAAGQVRVENNVIDAIAGVQGNPGGYGGDGGNGGGGGSPVGLLGLGGNGGDGGDGGDVDQAFGISGSGTVSLVNNTIVDVAADMQVGSGGAGGSKGTGAGSPVDGSPGSAGDYQMVYGINLYDAQAKAVNNIVATETASATSCGVGFSGTGSLALDYNDVYGWTQAYCNVTPGAHDIQQNPGFVNPASGDYHLSDTSPCRDAGTNSFGGLTMPTDDIDGEARPPGSSFDIGADEVWMKVYLPLVLRN
jgi:hypothetical protein